MSKNKKEKKQRAELDMETTIADMNVEGFRWYNPDKKKGKQNGIGPVSRKEYWAMVRGMFEDMLPFFISVIVGALLMVLLAYLWLK
jgi:hypothetical protein